LDAVEWTVSYYVTRGGFGQGSYVRWGDATYNTHIEGFQTSTVSVPEDHNTVSWTLSADDGAGSNDVLRYNVYRCDTEFGVYTYIGNSPAGTASYVDLMHGAADSTLWWYNVKAQDTTLNEETNTNRYRELMVGGDEPYPIPTAGFGVDDWIFVSFAYPMSGNIETILDDSVNGDGNTDWDVAKWYDPTTPADPWKTYRKLATTNDFTNIDETMGVWLRLTANGGDNVLSTSVESDYSGSSVAIPIEIGWNLVGYPSQNSMLASLAGLPGGVDIVAEYDGGSPYLLDEGLPSTITFSEGNA
jgi:hypothetical protein